VAAQHDFCPERRVSTHLDGNVSPIQIEDMKMIMVDVGLRFLSADVADLACPRHLDVPRQSGRAGDQDEKQTALDRMRS